MTPDYQCTLWPDGWPEWLGGTGTEWLQCCIAHDLGATDLELYACVAEVSWPMAVVMLAGLSTVGIAWRAIARRRKA